MIQEFSPIALRTRPFGELPAAPSGRGRRGAAATLQLLVIAAFGAASSGCFPALKEVRPKTVLRVSDARGAPVTDASFTLATFRQPFPFPRSTVLTTYRTDQNGTLSLRRKRKWVWQVLLPDGVTWFTWAYCIEKDGYQATAETNPEFGEPIAIVLTAAPSGSTCVWPRENEHYSAVRTSDDE